MFFEEVRLIGGPMDGEKLVSGVDDLVGFPTIKSGSSFNIGELKYEWDHVEGSVCYLRYAGHWSEDRDCKL